MAKASAYRWILPGLALGLLAWWWVQTRAPVQAPATDTIAPGVVESVAPVTRAAPGADRARVLPGGFDLPTLESATPAEVQSMRQAEATRSRAAPAPPPSYTGIDGKQHAIAYEQTPEERLREQAQSERRNLLMSQLKADPQGFARRHGLSAKEVQWILEGETDFPERLLD